jgi:hypothetical protein
MTRRTGRPGIDFGQIIQLIKVSRVPTRLKQMAGTNGGP